VRSPSTRRSKSVNCGVEAEETKSSDPSALKPNRNQAGFGAEGNRGRRRTAGKAGTRREAARAKRDKHTYGGGAASGGLSTGGGANPSAKTSHTTARRQEKTPGKKRWLDLENSIKDGGASQRKTQEAGTRAERLRAEARTQTLAPNQ
jgi:hypothetical protein